MDKQLFYDLANLLGKLKTDGERRRYVTAALIILYDRRREEELKTHKEAISSTEKEAKNE